MDKLKDLLLELQPKQQQTDQPPKSVAENFIRNLLETYFDLETHEMEGGKIQSHIDELEAIFYAYRQEGYDSGYDAGYESADRNR